MAFSDDVQLENVSCRLRADDDDDEAARTWEILTEIIANCAATPTRGESVVKYRKIRN